MEYTVEGKKVKIQFSEKDIKSLKDLGVSKNAVCAIILRERKHFLSLERDDDIFVEDKTTKLCVVFTATPKANTIQIKILAIFPDKNILIV